MRQPSPSKRIIKHPVDPTRIRKRPRQFACVDRALVYHRHICRMRLPEIALYVFLECVSDPQGLSYYSDKRICQYLHLNLDEFLHARAALISKQIILYACPMYQVLDLSPVATAPPGPSIPKPHRSGKRSFEEPVPISTAIKSIMEELSHADA